jgi:protein-S-isoprenylcysteine O-methyltransferase Ste14
LLVLVQGKLGGGRVGTILTVLASTIFAAFAWALRFHFSSLRMPIGMVGLSALSVTVFSISIAHFSTHPPDRMPFALAFAIMILAGGLFFWSVNASRNAKLRLAFDVIDQSELVDCGPFRFLRHPFYASYNLFWLACAIATGSIVVLLGSVALLSTYVVLARREERGLLASPVGESYRAYQARAGFMLPRIW